jgi:hypothetical protein
VFQPDIGGVDPMIAVGKEYVMVSEDHWIEFFEKDGDLAGTQSPSKAGEPTCLHVFLFFGGFLAPQNADGSVNRNSINRHLRYPSNVDSTLECDPTTAPPASPCITDFYDTRISYDHYRGRFVILSAARGFNLGTARGSEGDAIARRYLAVAVSKTEDPRDGFDQYITTESNYSDWPRLAINDGVLVSGHWGCKNPDDSDPCQDGDHKLVPLNTRALRPMAYVFNTDDMLAGQPAPRNWKIYPYQTHGGTLFPVIHHGPTQGFTYLVHPVLATGFDLFRFSQPATDWVHLPQLTSATIDIADPFHGFGEGLHFQNGQLYFAGGIKMVDRVPNVSPERWRVSGTRIAVTPTSGGGFTVGPCPGNGCLQFNFGSIDQDDPYGDNWSYEMPSMAVNAAGDMFLVHGRAPLFTAKPAGQEVRFRIYYNDSRGLQDGRLLQAGNTVLKDLYCSGTQLETTPVAENFIHFVYASSTCAGQKDFQDYGTAAVDPDGLSFWMAHAYGDSNGFKFVAGKVVP